MAWSSYLIAQWSDVDDLYSNIIRGTTEFDLYRYYYCQNINRKFAFFSSYANLCKLDHMTKQVIYVLNVAVIDLHININVPTFISIVQILYFTNFNIF